MQPAPSETTVATGTARGWDHVQIAGYITAALFFVYLFSVNMSMNLNDPDVYWHLKTGQYMLENKTIVDEDPFCYTSPSPLGEKQKMGLKAQWLGQIMFYLSYMAGGYAGVVVFRNLLIILPMIIVFLWLTRKGVSTWLSLLMIAAPALMLSFQLFYSFERPQGLSFNLILISVIMLERVRDKASQEGFDYSFWLFPVVMALWSNMHGGYVVGIFAILGYMFAEMVRISYEKYWKKREPDWKRNFFIVSAVAIAATCISPNFYHVTLDYGIGLARMFVRDVASSATGGQGSWVTKVVLEYKPLYYFYKYLAYDWLVFYWVFSGLAYIFVFARFWITRKVDLAELLTVTLVVVFANMYARGIMFSLTVMPFFIAKSYVEMTREVSKDKIAMTVKVLVASGAALLIGFCTYMYEKTPGIYKPGIANEWVTPWYPTRLSDFLKRVQIAPPMYNYYTWGGYLLWDLYPKYKVFIDGRAIDNRANETADAILKAYPGWQAQLDAYGINFIAIPVIFRESGHIIPLAMELATEDKWRLVFLMNNSAVFVRNEARNKDIITTYNLDKKYIYNEILNIENMFLQGIPNHSVFNIAKADALFGLGRYQEAKAIYERFPDDAADRLTALRNMGY